LRSFKGLFQKNATFLLKNLRIPFIFSNFARFWSLYRLCKSNFDVKNAIHDIDATHIPQRKIFDFSRPKTGGVFLP
jgi:hypothetical protein